MASSDQLSDQDKQFLARCEEAFKDRFTENDEAFMKFFKAEQSVPPIVESWWVPNNGGRRNDRHNERRLNRRSHPYRRHDDNRSSNDRSHGHQSNRPRQ